MSSFEVKQDTLDTLTTTWRMPNVWTANGYSYTITNVMTGVTESYTGTLTTPTNSDTPATFERVVTPALGSGRRVACGCATPDESQAVFFELIALWAAPKEGKHSCPLTAGLYRVVITASNANTGGTASNAAFPLATSSSGRVLGKCQRAKGCGVHTEAGAVLRCSATPASLANYVY